VDWNLEKEKLSRLERGSLEKHLSWRLCVARQEGKPLAVAL